MSNEEHSQELTSRIGEHDPQFSMCLVGVGGRTAPAQSWSFLSRSLAVAPWTHSRQRSVCGQQFRPRDSAHKAKNQNSDACTACLYHRSTALLLIKPRRTCHPQSRTRLVTCIVRPLPNVRLFPVKTRCTSAGFCPRTQA